MPSYTGENCEIPIDPCSKNRSLCGDFLCKRNASNKVRGYECICQEGFILKETLCEDINECLRNPCVNLSKCVNTYGSYYCICNENNYGTNCELSSFESYWSEWGRWSHCLNKKCGKGYQEAERQCLGPLNNCNGTRKKTRQCNLEKHCHSSDIVSDIWIYYEQYGNEFDSLIDKSKLLPNLKIK